MVPPCHLPHERPVAASLPRSTNAVPDCVSDECVPNPTEKLPPLKFVFVSPLVVAEVKFPLASLIKFKPTPLDQKDSGNAPNEAWEKGKETSRKLPAGGVPDPLPEDPEPEEPPDEPVDVVVPKACTWPLTVVRVCSERFNTLPLALTPVRLVAATAGNAVVDSDLVSVLLAVVELWVELCVVPPCPCF